MLGAGAVRMDLIHFDENHNTNNGGEIHFVAYMLMHNRCHCGTCKSYRKMLWLDIFIVAAVSVAAYYMLQ